MTGRSTVRAAVPRRPGLAWVGLVALLQISAKVFDWGPPFQPLIPVLFALTVPGFVLLDLRYPADRVSRFTLGVAGSLSFNVLAISVRLLPQPIWMVPVALAAILGLWRFGSARRSLLSGDELALDQVVVSPAGEEVLVGHDLPALREDHSSSPVSWKQRPYDRADVPTAQAHPSRRSESPTTGVPSSPDDAQAPAPIWIQLSPAEPATPEVATPEPATPEPATPEVVIPEPATPEPATPEVATPEPATPELATPEVVIPEPATPEPATPEVATPEPATPEPATPEVVIPEPATPEVVIPEPATPEVATPEPATPEVATPGVADSKRYVGRHRRVRTRSLGPLEEAIRAHSGKTESEGDEDPQLPDEAGRDDAGTPLVNVNSADVAVLANLPGLGPRLAGRLIEHRRRNGRFAELNDLLGVPGLGPVKVENLRNEIRFDDPPRSTMEDEVT